MAFAPPILTPPAPSPRPDSPESAAHDAALEAETRLELPAGALSGRDHTAENFAVLSPLVPAALRSDFAAVFAFCRFADDLADEVPQNAEGRALALRRLSAARAELARAGAYASDAAAPAPAHPIFARLAGTLRAHQMSTRPFEDLLDAFEQDQTLTEYTTWEELLDYCRRSADPVGRIVLHLSGVRAGSSNAAEIFRLSDLLCTALQLTNHWQDVRRDLLERGRMYLPCAETSLTKPDLQELLERPDDPSARLRFIHALRPLVARTAAMFVEGATLCSLVPRPIAPVIWLFHAGGAGTLDLIERRGCTSLFSRPALAKPAKALLVARAMALRALGTFRGNPPMTLVADSVKRSADA